MELSLRRIYCGVQNYAWGVPCDFESEVKRIFYSGHHERFQDQKTTYAELWMGVHPSLPSQTEDGSVIPVQLPYLFKVLSINEVPLYEI